MIVVDTSVWVAALRSATSAEARDLSALIDADEVGLPVPVRVELLSGASQRDFPALKRSLSALPVLYPTDDTWRLVGEWLERASRKGQCFGLGDLLIAAVTHEAGSILWSLDRDFTRMAAAGFIDLYEP